MWVVFWLKRAGGGKKMGKKAIVEVGNNCGEFK